MPKTKLKSKKNIRRKVSITEPDGVYFLKIVLYLIIATFWVRITDINLGIFTDLSIPVGAIIGILMARRETILTDRKIIYALILAGTILSFYLPVGIKL